MGGDRGERAFAPPTSPPLLGPDNLQTHVLSRAIYHPPSTKLSLVPPCDIFYKEHQYFPTFCVVSHFCNLVETVNKSVERNNRLPVRDKRTRQVQVTT